MSATNQTVWTCDRCKVEHIEAERGQPSAWSGAQMHVPPRSAEVHGKRQHLCGECTDLLVAFLENR